MGEIMPKDFWNLVFERAIVCPIDGIINWINDHIDSCPDRVFRSTWSRASEDYKKVVVKSIMRDIAAVLCQRYMPDYNQELNIYTTNE